MPTLLGRNYQLKELQYEWGKLYEARQGLLGTTATIFPMIDPHHGQPDATTFTSVGEEQVTCTWSEAPVLFDTPVDLTAPSSYRGIIPYVVFNGSDEEWDTPDADAWSFDDSGTNPFSFIFWINNDDLASTGSLFNKTDVDTNEEYIVNIRADESLQLFVIDESAAANVTRASDATVGNSQWSQIVVVYDSTGGSTAMNGVTIYKNGKSVASTATNDASYVAMENLGAVLSFGGRTGKASPSNFWAGKACGGPLGPTIVRAELAADVILRDWELGRRALAL